MTFPGKTTIAFVILTLAWLGCEKEKKAPEVLRPVRFETVYATGGDRARTFAGMSQAGQESRLSFKVAGTIKRIAVSLGDAVQPRSLIAELDPSDYRLQVQQAEASLDAARAQERNAEAAYERVRQLYETNSASRNDLDAARAGQESASAQVRALSKQLELAGARLSYTRLAAPTSGAIASVNVEVNENVSAGQTIVQLTSGERLEVEVAIPSTLISQLREGQAATVSFDGRPGVTFAGIITEVGVAASGFANTFPVTVRLSDNQPDLRPDMAAEVTLQFGSDGRPARFLVPPFAVGEDRLGRFIYTVQPGEQEGVGEVHRQAVTIGDLTENGLEVFEGLTDGARIITAGVSQLSEGMQVKFTAGEEN